MLETEVSAKKSLFTALNEFCASLELRLEAHQQAKAKRDLHQATSFSVFDYIQLDPNFDENRLSEIIAGLLNPQGTHGQGSLFLDLFLDRLPPLPRKKTAAPRIVREDPTAYTSSFQRRIDITIDFGSYGVGIENKPWATEAERQLEDYCDHLNRKYSGRFVLVYLSGDGCDPTSIAETLSRR